VSTIPALYAQADKIELRFPDDAPQLIGVNAVKVERLAMVN